VHVGIGGPSKPTVAMRFVAMNAIASPAAITIFGKIFFIEIFSLVNKVQPTIVNTERGI
jgi:hypothetical protein